MKRTSPMLAPIASILVGAALLLLFGSVPASAFDTKDIFHDLTSCNTVCGSNLSSCTTGCCSSGICSKTCVGICNAGYNGCLNLCSFNEISTGAFFDAATLSRNGRIVHLGGPLSCQEGATAYLEFSLTQDHGAVASGHTNAPCAADTTYTAKVTADWSTPLRPFATTQACGLARIHAANLSVAAFQWCREITLVPEALQLED